MVSSAIVGSAMVSSAIHMGQKKRVNASIAYGYSPGYTRLQVRGDLEKKKRVFASLGLLVPLTKVSL